MNTIEQNKFLGKLYDMLLRENIISETDKPKDLKTKVERVQKYFDKVQRVHDRATDNDRYLKMIKELYYERYIIKPESIPESYLRTLEKQYLDNGHGHVNLVEPKYPDDEILRTQHINNIIRDQKESLDNWLNYLLSPDSSYLEMWEKVWVFQEMLGIGNLNEEKNGYKKRSNVTVNPFVAIDSEILGKCVDLLRKSLNKKETTDNELDQIIKSGNFSKLYGTLLANKKQIKINSNDGIWVKYSYETEQEARKKEENGIEPEYVKLYNSLQGYNTGWCTAGSRQTAKEQICGSGSYLGGDFYVYYTKDDNGEYKIPRIAIRMDREQIGEIRGIAQNQNIEFSMQEVLEEKLKDFPGANKYQKKVNDMKKLTDIYYKNKSNIELTKDEIAFLYQLDNEIEGFGYGIDPRIEEIICNRDAGNDLNLLFEGIDEIKKDLDLSFLTTLKGVTFPKSMEGSLELDGLNSAKDVVFPQNMDGTLNLEGLINASNLVLPKKFSGFLYLDCIKSAKGVIFSESFDGILVLDSLRNAHDLILPENFTGILHLSGLIDLMGLKLPENFQGLIQYKGKLLKIEEIIERQKTEEMSRTNTKRRIRTM